MPRECSEVFTFKKLKRNWLGDRFITLMVIPERTRRVHKVVVPFFALKLGAIVVSLAVLLFLVVGLDYVQVLGRLAENKRLKGENFKLRQEMQTIRNKVESMEGTIERVRNYAKKMQILTGQSDSGSSGLTGELPMGPIETEPDRLPASKKKKKTSRVYIAPPTKTELEPKFENMGFRTDPTPIADRVERLQNLSLSAETSLSNLQGHLVARSALIAATPSLIPINGWVSSGFGYRRNPYDGSYRLHAGLDLAAEPGTPVRAPANGTIHFAEYREGYGKVVVIDHGYGIRTLYGHLARTFVTTGQRVVRGEKIAEVGSTGRSTGPHLHYEVRRNGVPVNPATFHSSSRF